MKPLVVFYSRTGRTKQVGEAIATALNCGNEELVDTRKRSGPIGFFQSGMEARSKQLTVLQPVRHDPSLYDIVILGTPIWMGTMSSAMRTYIAENKSKFNRVAFFCTQGGAEHKRVFDEMEALCDKQPVGTIAIRQNEVKKGDFQEKVRQFADSVREA
jgi:flavodoxin